MCDFGWFLRYFLLQVWLDFGRFGLWSRWLVVMGGFGLWNNFLLGLWLWIKMNFLIGWIYYFNVLKVKLEDVCMVYYKVVY